MSSVSHLEEAGHVQMGSKDFAPQSFDPVSKRLKVAVLTRHFTPQSGGAERYSMALVNCLRELHEVHVFAQRIDHAPPGVHYHLISEPFKRPRWLNQWWYAYQTWRLSREGFDVVHSHENTWHGQIQSVHVVPSSVTYFSSPSQTQGGLHWIKTVAKGLGLLLSPRMMTYLWFEHLRLNAKREKQVVSVSKSLEHQLTERFSLDEDHLCTISPGVDDAASWFSAQGLSEHSPQAKQNHARAQLGLDPSKTWLLWVGNDARKKGLKTLLHALAKLPKDVHLMVVGQARHGQKIFNACLQECGQEDLASRIEFLGALPDVSMAYVASDLLVHPTLEDTFGMVVLEAMSFGRPVCLSPVQCCGIAAHVKHLEEAYILEDPEDVQALVRGIEWLLDPYEGARIAQAGHVWSRTQNWPDKALAMEMLYFKSLSKSAISSSPRT